jgi:hypothetical protein
VPGVGEVLDEGGKREYGLDHDRSGELVLIAEPDAWFTYYYWLDDDKAPDYARTVDIHRKPGYDPVELFLDPAIKNPQRTLGLKLMKKKLGMRGLFDVIPLDASLVKGSHGRVPEDPADWPVLAGDFPHLDGISKISAVQVHQELLGAIRRGIAKGNAAGE